MFFPPVPTGTGCPRKALFLLSAGQCVTGPEMRFVKVGFAQNPELCVVDLHACF